MQSILWAGSAGDSAAISMLRKVRFQASEAVGTKVWALDVKPVDSQPHFSAVSKHTPGTPQTQPLPCVSDALAPDTGVCPCWKLTGQPQREDPGNPCFNSAVTKHILFLVFLRDRILSLAPKFSS